MTKHRIAFTLKTYRSHKSNYSCEVLKSKDMPAISISDFMRLMAYNFNRVTVECAYIEGQTFFVTCENELEFPNDWKLHNFEANGTIS